MFNLSVPLTQEDGASVPIRILDLERRLIRETKGLLVTGCTDNLINVTLASMIGLDGPCLITLKDATTTIEISETFRAVEIQRDVILGTSFMRHFVIKFDFRNKLVTLTQ